MTSEKVAAPLHRGAASRQSGPDAQKQNAARVALEAQVGHTLSDLEWGRGTSTTGGVRIASARLAPGCRNPGI
jgi:hypothetical protein